MTEKELQIKAKLLEKVLADKKIYLLKVSESVAKECNVTTSDVMKCVQKLYLKSDRTFRYDISKTNRGIKILALESCSYDIDIVTSIGQAETTHYLLSQFYGKVNDFDLKKICKLYNALTHDINTKSEVLYLIINKDSNNIYTKATMFNRDEIDWLLNLIAKHGYAYEKDNVLYWKTYSPNIIIEEEDLINQFTIMTRKEESVVIEEEEYIPKDRPEVIPMTTRTALDFLAKELGIGLTASESNQKLEEMIATTDELISNFNSLPDWEKLKSWDIFVKDWKAIMGDAMNDRN